MAVTLPDARELSDEVLEALRLRALRGCEMDLTEAQVAQLLGVTRETVSRWWVAYAQGGLDALPHRRSGRPTGSGRSLRDEQAARVQQLIDHNSPEELGVASPLWSRPAVRELIKKECGVEVAVRTVGEYLRRWGYTAKRPRRHAKKQDPFEVRQWLQEEYPAIEERARAEGATIHFCDETGVAADEHPGYGYARRGQPATMEVPDPHIRVNVISTVSSGGEAHFMSYTKSLTAALFITFLQKLLAETAGKVFLIADRHSAHDCEAVWDWVDDHQERIEMFLLPRRAGERNPEEYLNNDLKGNVHAQGLPNNKSELGSRVQAFLDRLIHLPERVMSYFQHPCVQYAAGK